MNLTRIHYQKPRTDPGMFSVYELNKLAPSGDYAVPAGIVVRYAPKKATLCHWESIAALIGEAMAVSPEFRAHIKTEVERAEAIASAQAAPVPA